MWLQAGLALGPFGSEVEFCHLLWQFVGLAWHHHCQANPDFGECLNYWFDRPPLMEKSQFGQMVHRCRSKSSFN
ncbi:MAG: hypothetical protein K1Y36_12385 [Blastocatellia bacterium]|nr:hypothetical protein [Blastocatellia bacterium]